MMRPEARGSGRAGRAVLHTQRTLQVAEMAREIAAKEVIEIASVCLRSINTQLQSSVFAKPAGLADYS